MGRAKSLMAFERVALESAVFANPAERTAQLALIDWLMENGYSERRARLITLVKAREGVEDRQRDRVYRWLNSEGYQAAEMRTRLRRRIHHSTADCLPIEVVPGGSRPLDMAAAGRWFDSETGVVLVRGKDAKRGAEAAVGIYVHRIVVGAAWVICQAQDMGFEIPD